MILRLTNRYYFSSQISHVFVTIFNEIDNKPTNVIMMNCTKRMGNFLTISTS